MTIRATKKAETIRTNTSTEGRTYGVLQLHIDVPILTASTYFSIHDLTIFPAPYSRRTSETDQIIKLFAPKRAIPIIHRLHGPVN